MYKQAIFDIIRHAAKISQTLLNKFIINKNVFFIAKTSVIHISNLNQQISKDQ